MKTFTASLLFVAANADGIVPGFLNPGAIRASEVCINKAGGLPLNVVINNLITGQSSRIYSIDQRKCFKIAEVMVSTKEDEYI